MAEAVHHHCTKPWYMRPPVWLAAVVAVLLLIFTIYEMSGRPAATPYGAFLDQLEAGNVASVTFQGTQIDGRFKHPVGDTASNAAAQRDTFRSHVPDVGDSTLIAQLRKQHVAIDVASSSSWTRLLAGIPLPMLFFIGIIVVAGVVRLVRGKTSSGTGGTAVPMHPMRGMIGLVSGLFGKQSPAASPPTRDGAGSKG